MPLSQCNVKKDAGRYAVRKGNLRSSGLSEEETLYAPILHRKTKTQRAWSIYSKEGEASAAAT